MKNDVTMTLSAKEAAYAVAGLTELVRVSAGEAQGKESIYELWPSLEKMRQASALAVRIHDALIHDETDAPTLEKPKRKHRRRHSPESETPAGEPVN
jgi:hypothetical protein